MRHLIIGFMILSFLAWPSIERIIQDSHKDKNGEFSQSHSEVEPQKSPRIPTPETKPDTQNTGNQAQTETKNWIYTVKEHSESRDWWYRAYVIATVVGVIAALFGLGFIWKQNQTIKDQLREMRSASQQTNRLVEQVSAGAEAARLNAQAVINAERAWIIVTSRKIEALTFDIEITNVGNTPAEFVSSFCEISVFERGNLLPRDPVYKTVSYQGLQPVLFPPKDTRIIWRKNVREAMKGQTPEQWIKSLVNGIQEMYLWSCLQYTDSLAVEKDGKPTIHGTRWSFKFMPPGQGVGPSMLSHPHLFPPSYVDYT
jgi:hypothetical protein